MKQQTVKKKYIVPDDVFVGDEVIGTVAKGKKNGWPKGHRVRRVFAGGVGYPNGRQYCIIADLINKKFYETVDVVKTGRSLNNDQSKQ